MVFAGAASAYGAQKYNQFCFLAACFSNWGTVNRLLTLIPYLDKIARLVGLAIEQIPHGPIVDLLPIVKECIDKGIPVLFRVKVNSLFYSPNFRKISDDYQHYIVVSDYDDERDIFIIRDNEQIYNSFNGLLDNDNVGLFKLQITSSMFRVICENMLESCTLVKSKRPSSVVNDRDLLAVLQTSLSYYSDMKYNRLVDFIMNIDNLYETAKLSIQTYYGSIQVLYNVIENICAEAGINLGEDYEKKKNNYLNKRYETLIRINVERSKDKNIDPSVKEKLIHEICKNDELLYAWVRQICENLNA